MDCSLILTDYKRFSVKDISIIINLEQLVIIFLEVFNHGFIKYFTFSRSTP